jgi:hypothetical protein
MPKIPDSYMGLGAKFGFPRHIRDAAAYQHLTGVIDLLTLVELTQEQADYLEAISLFLELYEASDLEERP